MWLGSSSWSPTVTDCAMVAAARALTLGLALLCAVAQAQYYGQRELTTTDCLGAPDWSVGAAGNPHAIAIADGPGTAAGHHCLDIQQAFTFRGAHVWLWPCLVLVAPGVLANENWLSNGTTIRSLQPNTSECLGINASGIGILADCASPAAAMTMTSNTSTIITGNGKCLTMGAQPAPPPPPAPPPVQKWNRPDVPLDERLDDLVARLSKADLVAQLGVDGTIGAITRPNLTVPSFAFQECMVGVAHINVPGNGTGTSAFPMPVNLGMTFDRDLLEAVGSAIGDEARALMNHGGLGGHGGAHAPSMCL